ncbi:MAG: ctaG [Gammaproteobacteria bacterium]|jgi:cytochrome c oxidase assembly protein subunit 11|nr:ctaG [Gammaproteobacteria bacterium]
MKPKNKAQKTLMILFGVAIFWFVFGWWIMPAMYNVFCQITGLNGKIEGPSGYTDNTVDKTRTITVQFVANVNAGLPWDFYPERDSIRLHPGEIVRVVFYAKNNSNKTMTVQAIPSVTPGQAARYLRKTECFCFTTETFKPGEVEQMPVLFHIDTELPKDINELSLSYTMYDTSNSPNLRANAVRGNGAHPI